MLILPLAVSSALIIITVISVDNELVIYNDNITDPWPSLMCTDDSLKPILFTKNWIKIEHTEFIRIITLKVDYSYVHMHAYTMHWQGQ